MFDTVPPRDPIIDYGAPGLFLRNVSGQEQPILTNVKPRVPGDSIGGWLLASASLLLTSLAVAMGIVSWRAQFAYVQAIKHQHVAAALEALGLDAGAVIFSVLGVALARLGRRAAIERALVCVCAAGSALMNLGMANLGSPRSVGVYIMPPVLFAITSDRLVSVIRRQALGPKADRDSQRSAWRIGGLAFLYLLRFPLAPISTPKGLRRMVLNATPLPEPAPKPEVVEAEIVGEPELPTAPEPPAILMRQVGPMETLPARRQRAQRTRTQPTRKSRRTGQPGGKQEALIRLAVDEHGLHELPLDQVSKLATSLATTVDLHPATARRVLLAHARSLRIGGASE